MSTIDFGQFSREYVLTPTWSEEIVRVAADYRDSTASDPMYRVVIPAGVWLVAVDNETRMTVTPVLIRQTRTKTYSSISRFSSGRFQVQSEKNSEMYFQLSGIPNTNDQANTRVGVTMTRMGGF